MEDYFTHVIDRVPENEDERRLIRSIVRTQVREFLHDETGVTCPCGSKIVIEQIEQPYGYFRCFYCHIYFCRKCAARHFGKDLK